jgi:hypothetical protein
MGDILHFNGIVRADTPVDDVFDKARGWGMTKCVVVGVNEDGELCFGGSTSDVALINLLLDQAKRIILEDPDDDPFEDELG